MNNLEPTKKDNWILIRGLLRTQHVRLTALSFGGALNTAEFLYKATVGIAPLSAPQIQPKVDEIALNRELLKQSKLYRVSYRQFLLAWGLAQNLGLTRIDKWLNEYINEKLVREFDDDYAQEAVRQNFLMQEDYESLRDCVKVITATKKLQNELNRYEVLAGDKSEVAG